ncbi:hypothetical protein [Nitrosomonas sp. Nm34]|uniref:hypothetical protein n=1 Tax=Nitrosomonas sp. Nm34 TaxID=1881055 RepID=UPI0008E8DA30|nr:hypothetical protein [Nitrosomonas sp. Nm34]SFI54441.1 hypothetical protein SAMN05428978_10163 [Nitrosomonas sp. Nm34]
MVFICRLSSFCSLPYSALVTDTDLPKTKLWRLYRVAVLTVRTVSKILKYDFGGESFNLRDFWATEAVLLTVTPDYNSMSLFRLAILRSDAVSGKG